MAISGGFELVLLFGAVLSFMISGMLWFYVKNFFANRVLSILSLVWGTSTLMFALQSKDFWMRFPHAFGLSSALPLLIFPLIYIYIRTYLFSDKRKLSIHLYHFIPVLLYLVAMYPVLFLGADAKRELIAYGDLSYVFNVLKINDIIISLQGVIYSALSIRTLHKVTYLRVRQLSPTQQIAINWLQWGVIVNVILWVIGVSGAFLEIINSQMPVDLFKVYYLGIVMLNIVVGGFTILRPHLFSMDESLDNFIEKSDEASESKDIPVSKGIDEEEMQKVLDYIKLEKPYMEKNIDLQKLLLKTGLSKRRLYELLGDQLNVSLVDLLNDFRINEMLEMLDKKMHLDYTLTHLSEMAGFQSKATFNRVFKKKTGVTPSEYITLSENKRVKRN